MRAAREPASLLRALTRRALGGPPVVAPAAVDWSALLALARREGVAPLLAGTTDLLPDAPPSWRAALARAYRESAGRAVLHAAALRRVLAALAAADVPALVLKGAVLAEALYADSARRPMSDLDLLVPREDVPRAARALAALGYRPVGDLAADLADRAAAAFAPTPIPTGSGRVPPAPGARSTAPIVDLHWDLVERWYGARPGAWPAGVWARAREITVDGVPAWTLAPADALLHACVHLAGNHGLRGLLWYCDVHLMARRWRAALAWDAVVATARAARLDGLVWAALTVVRAALGLEVPSGALAGLAPARRTRLAVGWLLPRLLAGRALPAHEYLVPLALVARARDVGAIVLARAGRAVGRRVGHARRGRAVAAEAPSR